MKKDDYLQFIWNKVYTGGINIKRFIAKLYQDKTVSSFALYIISSLLIFCLILSSIFIIKNNVVSTSALFGDSSSNNSSTKSKDDKNKQAEGDGNNAAKVDAQETKPIELPEKVCYLTFDDGPSQRTLEILDILDRYQVKASFFVVGTSNLSYVDDIHKRGHTVGLHTDTHVYSQIYSSDEAFMNDLNAVGGKVESILGFRPKIIRFPGGSDNAVSKICPGIMTRLTTTVVQNGYKYVDWNVVANDTTASLMQNINGQLMTPPNVIFDSVIRGSYMSDGTDKKQICVLMHDTGNKSSTVEALPAIIENLLQRGYAILPLNSDSPEFHAQRLNN